MGNSSTSTAMYSVFVRPNSRYLDERQEYKLDDFDDCQSAVIACKNIIDDFLIAHFSPGIASDALYQQYTMFGDDPFIVSSDNNCSFSAWNYAKARCIDLSKQEPTERKIEDVIERIRKIRDHIQKLEETKDEITEYLMSSDKIDVATKNMWVSDAKELYFTMVMVWDMVNLAAKKRQSDTEVIKGLLEESNGRHEQTLSEIRSFDDQKARLLTEKLRSSFDACWNSLSAEVKHLVPKKEAHKSEKSVIQISDTEYHLPCSVCNKISAVFKNGVPPYEKEEAMVYQGICHALGLDLEHADQIFNWLKQENILALHNFFRSEEYLKKDRRMEDGLDAYCPECNAIYCREHYGAREEWDQGFYDCTYGTCPQGHTRIIDD